MAKLVPFKQIHTDDDKFNLFQSWLKATLDSLANNVTALNTKFFGASPTTAGPLAVPGGGTGAATLKAHAVLVGEGISSIAAIGPGAAGQVLHGSSGDPTWAPVDLTADVNNTLPVGRGGTGFNTFAQHAVLVGEGTASFVAVGPGNTGQVLKGSTSNDPIWGASPTLVTATATFVAATTTMGYVICGGGGSGGSGGGGTNISSGGSNAGGGGGGGGAGTRFAGILTGLIVGATITITIGSGGASVAGAPVFSNGNAGNPGGTTSISDGGSHKAFAPGGSGGAAGVAASVSDTINNVASGGAPITANGTNAFTSQPSCPGTGGVGGLQFSGGANVSAQAGLDNLGELGSGPATGGTPGANGTASGAFSGGGGGAGGGAGGGTSGGTGGAGGAGGNGNNAGAGAAGSAPSAPAANTGAGGGGGGGGGNGSTAGGVGGASAAGASGYALVWWISV